MHVGFYQFAPEFGDKAANLAKVEQRLLNLNRPDQDQSIIVLPELFSTGYCFSSRDELAALAEETSSGPTAARLRKLARQTGLVIVAGIAERAGEMLYNSCVVMLPDGNQFTYRKIHLFCREKLYFDQSHDRPQIWKIGNANVGAVICFDYFFPELARLLALAGAQIICHPANLVLPFAQQMTVTRSLENRVFWVLGNRIGTEAWGGRRLTFTGQSQVVSPDGDLLFRAGSEEEVLKLVPIDPGQADDKMVGDNEVFRDRRPELYC
jgi:predicted amidohydrolase